MMWALKHANGALKIMMKRLISIGAVGHIEVIFQQKMRCGGVVGRKARTNLDVRVVSIRKKI